MIVVALVTMSLLKHEGNVTGKVILPNGRPAANAIVWFTGSVHAKPLARAVVDQRDRTFIPHVSVVTVGTQVDFPNNDIVFHNVFTEFSSTKFDLGNYPKGTKKSRVFGQPGLAVIMCSIHPDMGAYVMVVDTPYYTMTDKKGQYLIPGVPSGRYKAQVWHESGAKATLDTSTAESPHLDFQLRR